MTTWKLTWREVIDDVLFLYSHFRRYSVLCFFHHPFFQDWTFVDSICAVEYVKYFHATFDFGFDANDQVTNSIQYFLIFSSQIAVLQGSVIQLSILEMTHFSWTAGFDRLTFPDGTRPSTKHSKWGRMNIHWHLHSRSSSHSDSLISKIASLSLTRSELAIMKALLVCKAGEWWGGSKRKIRPHWTDGISVRGREALDELTLHLSKVSLDWSAMQKLTLTNH